MCKSATSGFFPIKAAFQKSELVFVNVMKVKMSTAGLQRALGSSQNSDPFRGPPRSP